MGREREDVLKIQQENDEEGARREKRRETRGCNTHTRITQASILFTHTHIRGKYTRRKKRCASQRNEWIVSWAKEPILLAPSILTIRALGFNKMNGVRVARLTARILAAVMHHRAMETHQCALLHLQRHVAFDSIASVNLILIILHPM